MDADGTKDGYDIELTQRVADAVNIPVIASGGCGNPEHIYEVLSRTKAEAALAASIFHYGELHRGGSEGLPARAGGAGQMTGAEVQRGGPDTGHRAGRPDQRGPDDGLHQPGGLPT